ncbi:hypothetical protein CsSME_00021836 [Camellia sinensis var. sinensis]
MVPGTNCKLRLNFFYNSFEFQRGLFEYFSSKIFSELMEQFSIICFFCLFSELSIISIKTGTISRNISWEVIHTLSNQTIYLLKNMSAAHQNHFNYSYCCLVNILGLALRFPSVYKLDDSVDL